MPSKAFVARAQFDERVHPDATRALADIAPGEEVVYYSGPTPSQLARPASFRPAATAYKEGRALLAQRRMGEVSGRNANGENVTFGVFDYIAIGRKRR